MKTSAIFALVLLALPAILPAQDAAPARPTVLLGPMIGVNAGINITDYGVVDVGRNVAPGSFFGVMADFPVSDVSSLVATLGYTTVAFSDENSFINDPVHDIQLPGVVKTEGHFSYLGLTTMVKVAGFLFGMHWGLPMGSTITNAPKDATKALTLKSDISPASSDLPFLMEARIGGEFTFLHTPGGDLRMGITAGWPFTVMATKSGGTPKMDDNFRIPNIMVHMSWMMDFWRK